jgi:MtN3 and saliva related transmembrane protein
MILDSVGYLGGFLIAVALAPQLIRAWKTKSTKDISILWTLVLLVGLLLYAFYAIINAIIPLMVFALVESGMVLILIGLKIKYER